MLAYGLGWGAGLAGQVAVRESLRFGIAQGPKPGQLFKQKFNELKVPSSWKESPPPHHTHPHTRPAPHAHLHIYSVNGLGRFGAARQMCFWIDGAQCTAVR